MAAVKRFNKLLGLENIDVLIDDRETSRFITITDMPQSLPQGKSSFLIEVSPYLKEGTEIQIDFVDSKGQSIYSEPVQNYLEGTSRTISVEVYDDTAAGIATLIIVGELQYIPETPGQFSAVRPVPKDFEGAYNIRLTREVIINPAELNIQPIKFYASPQLRAIEQRFGTLEREAGSPIASSSIFQIEGRPASGFEYRPFISGEDELLAKGAGIKEKRDIKREGPPKGDAKGDRADKQLNKQSSKKQSVRGDSRSKRSKRIKRRNSPIEYPYSYTIIGGEHKFDTTQIGGDILFSDITSSIYNDENLGDVGLGTSSDISFQIVTDVADRNFPTHYTGSIAQLENSQTAYVSTPFTKQNREGEYIVLPVRANAQIFYEVEPSASYSLQNIVSYADIRMGDMRTFSGDVFKAKVYVRAEGAFDDFKLLAEVPLESPELLINNDSVGIGERTGYFISEADKNTYWDLFGSTNGLTAATSTSTASFDNDSMLDSVMLSGSLATFTDQIRFQTKDNYKFDLTDGVDYTLSFKAKGEKGKDSRALMLLYISGSSMTQAKDIYTDEKTKNKIKEPHQYGKRLGVLELDKDDDTIKDFRTVNHNFNSDLTGDGLVQFRVISGKWNISDISIKPSADTGFSPSFIQFKQELPAELQHKRPETLEFLTEFYDMNNNIADEIAFTTGSVFTGGNIVISGNDNIQSGDMFLGGDTTGSGIHFGGVDSILPETGQEGATGSGFIRSIGYQGFVSASAQSGSYGFMIYSGSVLPDSGDSYKGVGLELVGESGSLKFRTSPSVFDVQADAFFVGRQGLQFLSGSSGNIEISSSKFHVDSKNENFSVGQPTGSRIQFDGTDLIMSSSKFFLGGAGQFVSGSEGNIEISSSNFHSNA